MAILDDPDDFADSAADDSSTNVFIDTAAKTIKLNTGVGSLVAADGALGRAVYSFLKEEWTNDPNSKNLASFPFPLEPITDEFFELIEGWDWADTETRETLRSVGWVVRDTSGNVTQHWAAIAAIGNTESDDQLYYDDGTGAADFAFPGPVNQAIQVISDPNGDGNYADGFDRSTTFTIYNREPAQFYSQASLLDIGVSNLLAPKVFAFALSTGDDLKITGVDTTIDANSDDTADVSPFSGMSITFHATPQSKAIGASSYDFGIVVEGNGGTAEQIYTFVQWALRRASDIDAGAGSIVGNVAPPLLRFTGDALSTLSAANHAGGGTGVLIENFDAADTNRLTFRDNTGTARAYPFTAALILTFNDVIQADASYRYWVYMTNPDGVVGGNDWGSSGGIPLEDTTPAAVEGRLVGGSPSVSIPYDYDVDATGGRTPGDPVAVTVVGIGSTGKYARSIGTINRSTTNTVGLVAGLDRQYVNV